MSRIAAMLGLISFTVPESWTWHDKWLWIANLSLAVIGFIGILIALGSLYVVWTQGRHIVISERAWVQVSKVALTSGGTDRPEGSKQVFVSCGAVNYGKTPARVLGLNVLLATGPIADPEKTWDESLYDFSGKAVPRWIVVPSIPKHLYAPIRGFTADPDDELPALDAGQAYFIHGLLRYWEAFSETDRFTRFCYREDREGSILGKGWHIAGGERCNQET